MANIKPVSLKKGAITSAQKQGRLEQEQKLRGAADKIVPPAHLNARQKKIFNFIVDELHASGILGNLDIYILSVLVFSVDQLQQIEKMINKDSDLMLNKELMKAKTIYTKDFFKCCNELSLSPQSRAKLGIINIQAKVKQDDPLLKVLQFKKKGGDNDDKIGN